ncbi:MAG: stage III sporulation protein AB [Oscillospiraceae bacterium]|jgi:stage III sporulation protein AA
MSTRREVTAMDGFDQALALLPWELRRAAMGLDERERKAAEELRLRVGYEPTYLSPDGERSFCQGVKLTARELESVLEIATGASVHSSADSVRRGFITVKGGCRIGLCGTAVMGDKGISGIKELSSVAIRIPREMKGCAGGIFQRLISGGFLSTIIISPPGVGKTTLLRELVRLLSLRGNRVSLADERGEVAAVWKGTPQFDVGPHTDVLTGAPKAESALLLLRAMNPQIIALDEITAPEDVQACKSAANCGVKLLATAHGDGVADLRGRALYRELLDAGVFSRAIVIRKENGRRVYEIEGLA